MTTEINLSYSALQKIALEINQACSTDIKRNDKKDVLIESILQTCENSLIASDIWLSYSLTDEQLIEQKDSIDKTLPKCFTRLNEIISTRLKTSKATKTEVRSAVPVKTFASDNPDTLGKAKSRVESRNIGKLNREISANTPNLQDDFARIGFSDQNGTLYRGEIAQQILTDLWDYDGKNTLIRPPFQVRSEGYKHPAIVHIFPVTKENVLGNDIPVRISNQTTVIQNNKVLRNSHNHGHTANQRLYDLKPLLSDGIVLLENIQKVEWFKTVESKKPQDKKSSSYRKNSVKSKIIWQTKYIAVDFSPKVSYGKLITLPIYEPSPKTVKCRLVLETTLAINLYRDDKLWLTVGRYSVQYDKSTNTLTACGEHFTNALLPGWEPILDKNIQGLIASNSHKIDTHNELTFLESIAYHEYRNSHGKTLNNKQYTKLKRQARKAMFSLYHSNPEALPSDVRKVCHKLDNDASLALDHKERSKLNKILIAYAKYQGLV